MIRTTLSRTVSRIDCEPRHPAQPPGLRLPIISHPSSTTNSPGFTLIELLVVISTIALLMAILLPTLQRVRKQARVVVCRAHLRQWAIILKGYTSGSEGALHNQGYCELAAPEFWMYWLTRNAPGTEKIRCCPMATRPAQPQGVPQTNKLARGGTFQAWGRFQPFASRHVRLSEFYHGSYAFNNWLSVPDASAPLIIGVSGSSPRRTVDDFWKDENVRNVADVPVFGDSLWWCAWPKDADRPPAHEEEIEQFPCGCSDSMRFFCINRHDGGINVAFLDGSVRRVGLKQLWTLKWHRNFNTANRWTKAGGARPDDWPPWMRHFKDY